MLQKTPARRRFDFLAAFGIVLAAFGFCAFYNLRFSSQLFAADPSTVLKCSLCAVASGFIAGVAGLIGRLSVSRKRRDEPQPHDEHNPP